MKINRNQQQPNVLNVIALNDPYRIPPDANPNRLLVVDDEPHILKSIVRSLRDQPGIDILTAGSGLQGIEIIKQTNIGVVLSDQSMPMMDGVCFLEKVREYDASIVRLMITGHAKLDNAIDAINRSHIFEYLTKPWDPDALSATLQRAFHHHHLTKENQRLQLVTRNQNLKLRKWNNDLEGQIKNRTRQLADAVREGVLMLSYAAEARDDDTGDHIKRIQHLTKLICMEIGMTESEADRVGFFSMMHDVGKIHVPDHILNKNGPLNKNEWHIMKQHTIAGEKILGTSHYYALARQIARSHHEWLDGSGYPDGLKGVDIPLAARVVAVADVFDALTHERPYKKAWPLHKAVDELIRLAGRQFDTDIVKAFVEIVSNSIFEGMER